MTLTPERRVLLTDALRPPAGCRVDAAVGTTYSLNLTALLLAPASFALMDPTSGGDDGGVDPIRLLEAVRRHAAHTTVFCQAGGIHVPGSYRQLLALVEDCVVEVMAAREGALFHPKLWALRFISQEGRHRHRLLVLSRNMTLDRSWDTALVLDEEEDGAIDAAPAAAFVRGLADLPIRPPSAERLTMIDDLADTLGAVRLGAPSPFTGGRLVPIGLTDEQVWPFPHQASRLLAISPFLTKAAVRSLARLTASRTLVSRPESLEMIGSAALAGWNVNVLQRLAEVDPDDDAADAPKALTEFDGASEGLHAKTFVLDLPAGQSMTVTGSANLTGTPWGGSVEFDTVLMGPTSACGVDATLYGSPEAPGLSTLLEVYAVTDEAGSLDPALENSYALERFHQQLAAALPALHVSDVADDQVDVRLAIALPHDLPGSTVVWPASLSWEVHAQPLDETLHWTMAPAHVTPFVAIETTAGDGATRVVRRCVLKASLTGAVDERRRDAVFSVLASKEDVLRYLVFLLSDPAHEALLADLAGVDEWRRRGEARVSFDADLAVFEPLVRAVGRDEDALARIVSLVEELRGHPHRDDLVPAGFDALWDVVWQAHLETRT